VITARFSSEAFWNWEDIFEVNKLMVRETTLFIENK
jgi:hypothetical protein